MQGLIDYMTLSSCFTTFFLNDKINKISSKQFYKNDEMRLNNKIRRRVKKYALECFLAIEDQRLYECLKNPEMYSSYLKWSPNMVKRYHETVISHKSPETPMAVNFLIKPAELNNIKLQIKVKLKYYYGNALWEKSIHTYTYISCFLYNISWISGGSLDK